MKDLALVSLLAGVLSFGVSSKAEEMTFASVYQLARAAAPNLALARYKLDSAASRRDVAFSRMYPQITLFGQYSENELEYEIVDSQLDERYPGERYGLRLSQQILNIPNGLEATRLRIVHDQVREELAVEETVLLGELLEVFLNVDLTDAELDQLETELKALQIQFSEATALYEKSLIPVTQLLETETRLNSLRADVITARGNSAIAREDLVRLTGLKSVEPMNVRENLSLVSRFKNIEDAAFEALVNDPAIAAAEASVLAAQRGIDREKSTWIPTFDITYSFQHSDVGFDNLASPPRDVSTVALEFNYPVFEGGAGLARLRGARADFYSAQTRLDAQKRLTETRARSAWLNLQAVTERLLAARQGLKAADTNVDATTKAVSLGVARVTDALLALAQNTRAKQEYSRAKFQYVLAWAEMELSVGGDPISLAPIISEALHGR